MSSEFADTQRVLALKTVREATARGLSLCSIRDLGKDGADFTLERLHQLMRIEEHFQAWLLYDQIDSLRQPAAVSESDRDFALNIQRICLESANGFQRFLRNRNAWAVTREALDTMFRVTGLALNAIHSFVKWGYFLNEPGRATPWKQVHALYALSEADGYSQVPFVLHSPQPSFKPSVQSLYLRTLLLDILNTGNLSKIQMEIPGGGCGWRHHPRDEQGADGPVARPGPAPAGLWAGHAREDRAQPRGRLPGGERSRAGRRHGRARRSRHRALAGVRPELQGLWTAGGSRRGGADPLELHHRATQSRYRRLDRGPGGAQARQSRAWRDPGGHRGARLPSDPGGPGARLRRRRHGASALPARLRYQRQARLGDRARGRLPLRPEPRHQCRSRAVPGAPESHHSQGRGLDQGALRDRVEGLRRARRLRASLGSAFSSR